MREYAEASRAPNTWKAYQSDLRHFSTWCEEHGLDVQLPVRPSTVAAYLADFAGTHKTSTLQRRLYALSALHKAASHASPAEAPEVQAVWAGIKRTHRTAPTKKAPATTKVMARLVRPLGDSLIDVRDRALLLIGYAGAFRRSELVALDVEDITEVDDGLRITLARSKADQEGEGAVIGIPFGSNPVTCPVRAWRAWLAASGITTGAAFLSIHRDHKVRQRRLTDRAVAQMVQRRAAAADLDPTVFGGHSLRAGFATQGFTHGVPEFRIMTDGRWRSSSSMRGYIREGELFRDSTASKLGL
jgi:site-specific recombinase XerD